MIIKSGTVQKIRELGYTVKYLDPEMGSELEIENFFLNRPVLEDDTPVAFFKPDGTEIFPFFDRGNEWIWSNHLANPPAEETPAALSCDCLACEARRNFQPAPVGIWKQYRLTKGDGTEKVFLARVVDGKFIDGYNRPLFCSDDLTAEQVAAATGKSRHEISTDLLALALSETDPRVKRDRQ